MHRTIPDVDAEIVDITFIRDHGRMRGEHRPLPRRVDELLDERLALTPPPLPPKEDS